MIIAVDTGGTKTLVTAFGRDGVPGPEYRFETPHDTDDYLHILLSHITDTYKKSAISAISIAVPGVVRGGTALSCPHLGWEHFPLGTHIKRHFPGVPVLVGNDADFAGLAEANALKKIPDVCLYLTISTGIGSGIINDGRLLDENVNSEAGHMMLEFDGKLRTWESFASGAAIKRTYGKYARDIADKRIWQQIARKIARGLVVIIPLQQPDVIVLGGSIGTHFAHYSSYLQAELERLLPHFVARPVIRQAKHPEEAVLYGCYYYAVHKLQKPGH